MNSLTPEEIQASYKNLTQAGVKQLANFLSNWMPEEAGKTPLLDMEEMKKDGVTPHAQVTQLIGSCYDWFAYGN